MTNPFYRRLRQFIELSDHDEALLAELLGQPSDVSPHHVLVQQGSAPKDIHLIVEGMACLERSLANGTGVISGLLLPGDLCCTSMEVSRRATHAVVTLSRCSIIKINQNTFDRIATDLPHVVRGLWRLALAEQSIAREWFVNVAGRPAGTRMAHLFCEMLARLQLVGLAEGRAFPFPLTQRNLAEILGMSAVHVNRTLQDLRTHNLVVFDSKHVEIPDPEKLKAFCHFSADYLLLSAGPRLSMAPPLSYAQVS